MGRVQIRISPSKTKVLGKYLLFELNSNIFTTRLCDSFYLRLFGIFLSVLWDFLGAVCLAETLGDVFFDNGLVFAFVFAPDDWLGFGRLDFATRDFDLGIAVRLTFLVGLSTSVFIVFIFFSFDLSLLCWFFSFSFSLSPTLNTLES